MRQINAYYFEGSTFEGEERASCNDNLSQMYMIFGDTLPTSLHSYTSCGVAVVEGDGRLGENGSPWRREGCGIE